MFRLRVAIQNPASDMTGHENRHLRTFTAERCCRATHLVFAVGDFSSNINYLLQIYSTYVCMPWAVSLVARPADEGGGQYAVQLLSLVVHFTFSTTNLDFQTGRLVSYSWRAYIFQSPGAQCYPPLGSPTWPYN